MKSKIEYICLAWVLLFLFFLGKLVVGFAGGSYELGNRLFAMVPMTVHLCLFFGAAARAFRGESLGYAAVCGVLIALFAQALIFTGTMGSIVLGLETAFNNPIAIFGTPSRRSRSGAPSARRAVGIVINSIIGAISGSIGWALGKLLPSS